jgi:hypothetical protein
MHNIFCISIFYSVLVRTRMLMLIDLVFKLSMSESDHKRMRERYGPCRAIGPITLDKKS